MHIDDWIDSPVCKNDGERYAKFVFWHFRAPAWTHGTFHTWMKQFTLFCDYQGKRYRVNGASRLGDIWLAEDHSREHGYDHRVDVEECSNWGQYAVSAPETVTDIIQQFIDKHNISCPESIYQRDAVQIDALPLVERLCEMVGYKNDE